MDNRRTLAPWKPAICILGVALILAFSLHVLAGPAASGGRPQHGTCCSLLIENYCPPCLGVWICADPEKRSTCSCICGPIAEQYGCPWTIVWCE